MAVETYFCYCIDVSILADPLSVGIFEPPRPLGLHQRCSDPRNDQISLDLAATTLKESSTFRVPVVNFLASRHLVDLYTGKRNFLFLSFSAISADKAYLKCQMPGRAAGGAAHP